MMRKQIRFLLFFVIGVSILNSCQTAHYKHDLASTPYRVDYSKGKWLLNDVDGPYSIKDVLQKMAKKEFSKYLGDAFLSQDENTTFAIPYVPINPDTLVLKQVKKLSNYDFLINIKGDVIKNQLGSIQIGEPNIYQQNRSETILQIYDLNTLETIYTRKVIATLSPLEDDPDFYFVQSAYSMIEKSLKKIFKKLHKK